MTGWLGLLVFLGIAAGAFHFHQEDSGDDTVATSGDDGDADDPAPDGQGDMMDEMDGPGPDGDGSDDPPTPDGDENDGDNPDPDEIPVQLSAVIGRGDFDDGPVILRGGAGPNTFDVTFDVEDYGLSGSDDEPRAVEIIDFDPQSDRLEITLRTPADEPVDFTFIQRTDNDTGELFGTVIMSELETGQIFRGYGGAGEDALSHLPGEPSPSTFIDGGAGADTLFAATDYGILLGGSGDDALELIGPGLADGGTGEDTVNITDGAAQTGVGEFVFFGTGDSVSGQTLTGSISLSEGSAVTTIAITPAAVSQEFLLPNQDIELSLTDVPAGFDVSDLEFRDTNVFRGAGSYTETTDVFPGGQHVISFELPEFAVPPSQGIRLD